jgi:hypothetical protein
MVREPGAADGEIQIVRSNSEALLTAIETIEIPAPNLALAASWNPDPSTRTRRVEPRGPLAGEADPGRGPASIMKQASQVPEAPSGLVTVAPRRPAGASVATWMTAVSLPLVT